MRYIIHGDDIVSSRSYLNSLKDQYQDVVYLDGLKHTPSDFLDISANQPLFPKKTLVIVENYTGTEKIFEVKTLLDTAFWWPRALKKIPLADKVLQFKSQSAFGIFKYTDSVGLKQTKAALVLLNRLLEERVPAEKIITMLTRQIRMIGQVLDGGEVKASSSDFVRKKLAQQAKSWDMKKIQEALMVLFSVDIKIKKGKIKPDSALTFLTYRLCR